MPYKSTSIPPFSPVLLAGMAMPQIARPVVGRIAGSFASGLWSRHRKSFERLSDFEGARILVDPVDLPLVFLLELRAGGPVLQTFAESEEAEGVSATIRGSLKSLLDLAEGRVDGDTLFFNRDLSIEGDTEAVVALRNAIDDADLDLMREFAQVFGVLAEPAYQTACLSAVVFQRFSRDTEVLQRAILAPLSGRLGALEKTSGDIEKRLGDLETIVRRQFARVAKKTRKKKAEPSNG